MDEESKSSSSSRGSSISPPPKKPKRSGKSPNSNSGSTKRKDIESDFEDPSEGKNSNNHSLKLLSGSDSASESSASGSESESGSEHSEDEEEEEEKDEEAEEDDDDGERSRHSSEDDDDIIEDEKDRSSRSRSRSVSGSGTGSRSGSASSHSGSEDGTGSEGGGDSQDIKKMWENDPEMFGIRRSNRKRPTEPKPPKLVAQVKSKKASPSKKPPVVSRKRKMSTDDEDESSSDEEVTRTVRTRTNAVSYKETEISDDDDKLTEDEDENGKEEPEEEEEPVDTIEKVIESRKAKIGATGPDTTVYAIEENGDPNQNLPADTEKERQFLIKWTGLSHLHNTWESFETLQEKRVKGLKKLDNFCKKEDDHRRWKDYACIEDVEYMECQLELQQELYKAYYLPERIIAERMGAEGTVEYYVKWECLPYADATWENGKLVSSRSPLIIEKFKKREASNKTPSSSTKSLRHRPKFAPIKYQPPYMTGEQKNLELRDYQLDGLNWLVHSWCKENSVILADEMGLGKTIQTICFLSYLFETYQLHGPYLVVVPLSTMASWQKEFSQWAPQINVVTYVGDVGSRDIIREYEWCFRDSRKMKFNAILTTYEIVLKDKVYLAQLPWACLMVDEAHRLKNGESLLYKILCEFETNHRLLITGTPLQNSLRELWSLLHFIMPYKFDDWETFEKEHDQSSSKGYGKLHKQLEPFILRRVKKDVEKSLPAKVEQILRVEMTSIQKQYYKWILTKNYTALRKGLKGSVSSFINVVMELKKCCNHASLVKPLESAQDTLTTLIKGSGKLMLLDKLLVRLKETGHRVLIFSQMVMMLDIIAEYLQHRRFAFQRLDGSIKGDMRKQALDHFNAEGSQDFCFLLSTRAGGLGINLATADTVIIFDSDWNPQNDLQAQARAHRIGQKNQVNIYRLVTKNSVEEDIVERAKKKMVLDHLVIQRMDTTGRTVFDSKSSKSSTPFNKDELTAILKFGAEQLFQEDDNDGEDQCDIDEILRRAETHEEASRPGDELLSAFKVASFSMNEDEADIQEPTSTMKQEVKDWEAIIPEDLRLKVEQDEKEKEMADLYLPPRSSRSQAASDKLQPLGNEALNKKARGKKRKMINDSDDSDYEDDDGRPKKRGRPKGHGKDGLKGFTDAQVRKFLKSLKKFPCPLQRIELIAEDSGLTEKNLGDLKKLGELLIHGCKSAIAEQKANPQAPIKEELATPPDGVEDGAEGKKKPQKIREKGPIYKVCGVNVNARTMSIALEELEPLAELIPLEESIRKQWKFDLKAKATQYDVDWGSEEDSKLLLGVWEFGMGAYDKIRESDPILKEKIFLEGDKKPTLKHASQRADYLLRVIKKHQAIQRSKAPKPIKEKKKREAKGKKGNAEGTENNANAGGGKKGSSEDASVAVDSSGKPKKKRAPRKKKDVGPMHFAAKTEPTPVNVLGDLDPVIFNECKEKMRPVKKALKSLDNPDPNMDEKDQIEHTKRCLIQVGDRIQECLQTFSDKEQVREWKSNLWYFVSKFTEYDAQKLHRVYKKAVMHRDKQPDEKSANSEAKHKEKKHHHKKHKKERETQKGAPNENSNSSFGDGYTPTKGSKQTHKERSAPADNRGHGKQGYMAAEYDRNSNDSFTPTYGQYNRSKFSTQASVSNGPSHYPHDSTPASHHPVVYRERQRGGGERAPGDPRAGRVAPGDPRDVGGHYPKNYHHYDADVRQGGRPTNPSRPGGGGSGASGWSKNRWESASHYGGPRRDDPSAAYYNGSVSRGSSSSSTVGGAPTPPAGGGSPYQSSSSSSVGRIAPPLTQAEWRRSDPKRQFYGNPPASDGRSKNSNSVSRRPDNYDKY